MFTETEILLAADRFLILRSGSTTRIRLAEHFMMKDQDLSTLAECLGRVRMALEKGGKIYIEVFHGYSRVSGATGQ